MTIQSVTVFCASSRKSSEKYIQATNELADILFEHNISVKYGGGALGLMGCLADRILKRGGNIIGVIPEFMVKVEWAHPGVKDMIVVHDMHERKRLLIHNTDAVVALPGGTGTLEELMEVMTLKRLGKFMKPIVLVNTDGFYNQLIGFFDTMVKEHFIRHEHLNIFSIVEKPADVLEAIKNPPYWGEDALQRAPV